MDALPTDINIHIFIFVGLPTALALTVWPMPSGAGVNGYIGENRRIQATNNLLLSTNL